MIMLRRCHVCRRRDAELTEQSTRRLRLNAPRLLQERSALAQEAARRAMPHTEQERESVQRARFAGAARESTPRGADEAETENSDERVLRAPKRCRRAR